MFLKACSNMNQESWRSRRESPRIPSYKDGIASRLVDRSAPLTCGKTQFPGSPSGSQTSGTNSSKIFRL
jgi:hypothetical protein